MNQSMNQSLTEAAQHSRMDQTTQSNSQTSSCQCIKSTARQQPTQQSVNIFIATCDVKYTYTWNEAWR